MADLDSASKRESGRHHGLVWLRGPPLPDGTVGDGDRQQLAGLYSGISAGEAQIATGGAGGMGAMLFAILEDERRGGGITVYEPGRRR